MWGLIGLIIATKASKQLKITMQDRYLCCLPTFSLTPQWPPLFFILESSLGVMSTAEWLHSKHPTTGGEKDFLESFV